MRESLITAAMEDIPATCRGNREALDRQRGAKQRKEDLLREISMEHASETFIEALYYHDMFASPACWMTTKVVDRELKKLKSKAAKLNALKENIRIRVIGFGWKDLSTPWSKNGVAYTPAELASHLKMMLSKQRSRQIPEKPPVLLPQRKSVPLLGTQAPDVMAIDEARKKDEEEFEEKARRVQKELEAVGGGR